MIFYMDDIATTMKVPMKNSILSIASIASNKICFPYYNIPKDIQSFGNLGNCTHIRWRTINGLTPHRFGMITNAETADRRPWHIQKTMFNSSALKVRTILLQGVWNDFPYLWLKLACNVIQFSRPFITCVRTPLVEILKSRIINNSESSPLKLFTRLF